RMWMLSASSSRKCVRLRVILDNSGDSRDREYLAGFWRSGETSASAHLPGRPRADISRLAPSPSIEQAGIPVIRPRLRRPLRRRHECKAVEKDPCTTMTTHRCAAPVALDPRGASVVDD